MRDLENTLNEMFTHFSDLMDIRFQALESRLNRLEGGAADVPKASEPLPTAEQLNATPVATPLTTAEISDTIIDVLNKGPRNE